MLDFSNAPLNVVVYSLSQKKMVHVEMGNFILINNCLIFSKVFYMIFKITKLALKCRLFPGFVSSNLHLSFARYVWLATNT